MFALFAASLALQPVTTEPVQAKWIFPPDYPAALLSAKKQGRTEFRLAFDPAGRLTDCTILKSAGHALLDATACRLSLRRARAKPDEPRVQTFYVDWRPER